MLVFIREKYSSKTKKALKMKKHNMWLWYIIVILFEGCNDNGNLFSPYSALEDDYSVHCIVDNRNQLNILRVQKIYFKKDNAAMEGKTTAVLSDINGKEIALRDTLINGSNTTNFIIPANVLERGMNYRINVDNETQGKRWGYFQMFPDPGIHYSLFIDEKQSLLPKWQLTILFKRNFDVAFMQRLFLYYEELENGVWVKHSEEIPVDLQIIAKLRRTVIVNNVEKTFWDLIDYDIKELSATYPKLLLTENITKEISMVNGEYSVLYDGWFIYTVMRSIGIGKDPKTIKITGMSAVLSQIEKNYFYNYMADSRVKTSIRLDEQLLVSNIRKKEGSGYRLISSVTSDTLHLTAWYFYIQKLGYINGQ
jgi:hypothetical protein